MNRYKTAQTDTQRKQIHSGQPGRTGKNLGVVVAQGKGGHCHDLRDGTEPEDLGISEFVKVPEALRCMPTRTTKGKLQTLTCHKGNRVKDHRSLNG